MHEPRKCLFFFSPPGRRDFSLSERQTQLKRGVRQSCASLYSWIIRCMLSPYNVQLEHPACRALQKSFLSEIRSRAEKQLIESRHTLRSGMVPSQKPLLEENKRHRNAIHTCANSNIFIYNSRTVCSIIQPVHTEQPVYQAHICVEVFPRLLLQL